MQWPAARIVGTGHFLPSIVRTNADLERMVDTSDDWIVERTGIRERRVAPEGMVTSDMATEAARRALDAAELDPKQLDMILVATVTPDVPMPATAVMVQQKLGAGTCPAMDLSAACAGFVFALSIADQFIRSGAMRYVLVVGVEMLSRAVDWSDRTTCVLFGDGAGAVVLGPAGGAELRGKARGILATRMASDGTLARSLVIPAGGTEQPIDANVIERRDHKIHMKGQDIFKVAVKNLEGASRAALDELGMTGDDLDWICPHQANLRIIDLAVSRLGIQRDKILVNIERVGNTSSASIPILLDESLRAGKVRAGDTVLFCALGAGVSWGAAVARI
ncbi:MAG TPA: beta-ketoacyl-ACP synthase III [Polyangiaceae bacterium]|jgi:3-oxoacyl-[acyl-carrier-protein] synthase-3|nr:beta-ketoacyl-ACP synthase III [Polyangiaceae bacterium]